MSFAEFTQRVRKVKSIFFIIIIIIIIIDRTSMGELIINKLSKQNIYLFILISIFLFIYLFIFIYCNNQ